MSKPLNIKRSAYIGASVMIASAVLLELIAAIQFSFFRDEIEKELEIKAESELTLKAIITKNILSNTEKTLVGHIWDMKRELNHPDSMFNVVRWIVKSNTVLSGCGIAFKPYYYPEKGRLFEPYAQRLGKKIVTHQAADSTHDYTIEGFYPYVVNTHQVGDSIKQKQACWSEPYFDHVTMKNTVTLSLPIWDENRHFVAEFGLDISLDLLGDTLNQRHIYPSSYDLLLSEKGELMAGPLVTQKNRETLMNIVRIINDSTVEKTKSKSGNSSLVPFEDPDGRTGMVFYRFFRGQPRWQVAVVCYDDEVFGALSAIQTKILCFSLLGLMVLGFILYYAMRNIRRLQRASMNQELINSELRIASKIQSEMLPGFGDVDTNSDVFDISCSLVSAKEVGGDLYDYFVRDDKLFFCIGDVSGKGVPSAIVMAVIHSLFRMATTHEDNPARIMQTINEVSCQNNRTSMFVTFFLGVLDLPTGLLQYCNAGHDAPIVVGHDLLPVAANLPVGLFSDYSYQTQETQLCAGQMLFLYTDGLTEAKNLQHQQFGLARVQEVLKGNGDKTPQQLLDMMSDSVHVFIHGNSQSDDLTMMAICYNGVSHDSI